jgi:hypothetical protein
MSCNDIRAASSIPPMSKLLSMLISFSSMSSLPNVLLKLIDDYTDKSHYIILVAKSGSISTTTATYVLDCSSHNLLETKPQWYSLPELNNARGGASIFAVIPTTSNTVASSSSSTSATTPTAAAAAAAAAVVSSSIAFYQLDGRRPYQNLQTLTIPSHVLAMKRPIIVPVTSSTTTVDAAVANMSTGWSVVIDGTYPILHDFDDIECHLPDTHLLTAIGKDYHYIQVVTQPSLQNNNLDPIHKQPNGWLLVEDQIHIQVDLMCAMDGKLWIWDGSVQSRKNKNETYHSPGSCYRPPRHLLNNNTNHNAREQSDDDTTSTSGWRSISSTPSAEHFPPLSDEERKFVGDLRSCWSVAVPIDSIHCIMMISSLGYNYSSNEATICIYDTITDTYHIKRWVIPLSLFNMIHYIIKYVNGHIIMIARDLENPMFIQMEIEFDTYMNKCYILPIDSLLDRSKPIGAAQLPDKITLDNYICLNDQFAHLPLFDGITSCVVSF